MITYNELEIFAAVKQVAITATSLHIASHTSCIHGEWGWRQASTGYNIKARAAINQYF